MARLSPAVYAMTSQGVVCRKHLSGTFTLHAAYVLWTEEYVKD